MRILIPKAYSYCRVKCAMVSQCLVEGELRFDFCRAFAQEDLQEWEDLNRLVQDVSLNLVQYQVFWALEKSKCQTYVQIFDIEMKLKGFMWLAMQQRLQTGTALKKRRNGKGIRDVVYVGWMRT